MSYFSLKRPLRAWPSLVTIAVLILFFTSCSDDSEAPLSKACKILSFKIEDFEVDTTTGSIVIVVPPGTDISDLRPIIEVSEGATINPASGVPQDFSKPGGVSYIVTAASKDKSATYTVRVQYALGVKDFWLEIVGLKYQGVFDPVKGEIRVNANFLEIRQFNSIGDKLLTHVTMEEGFSILPAAGTPIDIDHPVIHTIHDNATGADKNYKLVLLNSDLRTPFVNINIPGVASTFHSGVAPSLAFPEYTTGLNEGDFVFRVLTTDDISALTLHISAFEMPERATFVPALDAPQNFSQDVTYTVTAEAGNTKSFKARVVREKFVSANSGDIRDSESYPRNDYYLQVSYRAISPVASAKLIAESDNAEYTGTTITEPYGNEYDYLIGLMRLQFHPTNPVPAGDYKLHVTLENGESFVTKTKVKSY